MRRVATDWMRRSARTQLSDDFEKWAGDLCDGQDVEGAVLSAEEGSLVLRAYRSLPERWQAVLWHAVVEHEPATETARRLGISAGGVGSLAARAREGLREAYLRAHLDQSASEECRHYGGLLAAALRRPATRVTRDLRHHLRACPDCARAERDLRHVNRSLGALLPAGILLWSPGSFFASAGGHGAAQLAAAGKLGGIKAGGIKAGGAKLGGIKPAAARFGSTKWTVAAAAVAGTMTAFVLLPAEDGPGAAAPPAPLAASPNPDPVPTPRPEASGTPFVSVGVAMSGTASAAPSPVAATSAAASPVPSASASVSPPRLPPVRPAPRWSTPPRGCASGWAAAVRAGRWSSSGAPRTPPRAGSACRPGRARTSSGTRAPAPASTEPPAAGTSSASASAPAAPTRAARHSSGGSTRSRNRARTGSGSCRRSGRPTTPTTCWARGTGRRPIPPCPGSSLVHLPDYYNSVNFHFSLG
ncbi:hypothetical protein GCM10020254_02570 [Streptomyces goshikiensis]